MRCGDVAFLFAGVGDHYPGMGRGLYDGEPAFRAAVDECCTILAPHLGADPRGVLYAAVPPESGPRNTGGIDLRAMLQRGSRESDAPPDARADELNRTRMAQAALFVTGYALARSWHARGVTPAAMIGHSLGEYVAATVAGVFRLEDALALVAERSRIIELLPQGAMIAVPMSESELRPLLGRDLWIATMNAPAATTVSGTAAAVDALERALGEQGVAFRRLPVQHAFHSPLMAPATPRIADRLAGMTLRAPRIPFISNVTGTWITDAEALNREYWAQHLSSTVRFGEGVLTLLDDANRNGGTTLLEIGPGGTLGIFARQCAAAAGLPEPVIVRSMRHAYDSTSDIEVLADAAHRIRHGAPGPVEPGEATTTAQALIADIWREVLGAREVDVHEDFFALGGSSLGAARVLSRIREAFEVTLPLRVIFETRTVAQLAAAVEAAIVLEVSELSDEEAARLL
jgi:acyl transferase domain-containing protein/acyl carrier protein